MDPAIPAEEPRVMDTYALVYAFSLLLLVPGLLALQTLTYRVYSFAYVSLVVAPFFLGMAATFLTDSRDGIKRFAVRTLVLAPLIGITGVGLMFGLSIVVFVPLNPYFDQSNFEILGLFAALALAVVAGPLVPALVRRVRGERSWSSVVQGIALAGALALVAYTLVLTFDTSDAMTQVVRKDSLIYFIGALTWYLPAFGFAAGVWRRTGLV